MPATTPPVPAIPAIPSTIPSVIPSGVLSGLSPKLGDEPPPIGPNAGLLAFATYSSAFPEGVKLMMTFGDANKDDYWFCWKIVTLVKGATQTVPVSWFIDTAFFMPIFGKDRVIRQIDSGETISVKEREAPDPKQPPVQYMTSPARGQGLGRLYECKNECKKTTFSIGFGFCDYLGGSLAPLAFWNRVGIRSSVKTAPFKSIVKIYVLKDEDIKEGQMYGPMEKLPLAWTGALFVVTIPFAPKPIIQAISGPFNTEEEEKKDKEGDKGEGDKNKEKEEKTMEKEEKKDDAGNKDEADNKTKKDDPPKTSTLSGGGGSGGTSGAETSPADKGNSSTNAGNTVTPPPPPPTETMDMGNNAGGAPK